MGMDEDFFLGKAWSDDYIGEVFDRMKRDPKYRPVVKRMAAKGDKECVEVMVLWDAHVKEMRRLHASR